MDEVFLIVSASVLLPVGLVRAQSINSVGKTQKHKAVRQKIS